MFSRLFNKRKASSPDHSDRPLKVAVIETISEDGPYEGTDTAHRGAASKPKGTSASGKCAFVRHPSCR
jgi:hypothetical protein